MDGQVAAYLITAVDSWEEHTLLSNMSSYIPEIAAQIIKNKSPSEINSTCLKTPNIMYYMTIHDLS